MKSAVIVFPGSNCDRDVAVALEQVSGQKPAMVWHGDSELAKTDLIVLPGGFSYGDYLRTGSIARFSPVMASVLAFAEAGGPVLGICNGFQILLETGLLPGGMLYNRSVKFQCEQVYVRVEELDTSFTCAATLGQVLRIPIAHGEGNYFAPPDELDLLEANRQVVFRYCDVEGAVVDAANPNGSARGIAGLCNKQRNVVALMPHPERACESAMGSADGLVVLESAIAQLKSDGMVLPG